MQDHTAALLVTQVESWRDVLYDFADITIFRFRFRFSSKTTFSYTLIEDIELHGIFSGESRL